MAESEIVVSMVTEAVTTPTHAARTVPSKMVVIASPPLSLLRIRYKASYILLSLIHI